MQAQEAVAAGFWRSNWSASQAATAGREINELKASAQGVFWTETNPETAQTVLYRYQHSTQQIAVLTAVGFSVRSRVYEYGGASFCLLPQGVVFTNESDQQLYLQTWLGPPQALTQRSHCRYADMQYDTLTNGIIAIEEEHHVHAVIHRLVYISCSNKELSTKHTIKVIHSGSDFYAAPRLSPDAQRLAWIAWQRPDQPWTQTQLMCAQRKHDQSWSTPVSIAGAEGDAALQQPQFDHHNRLTVLNDQEGYWQPWQEQSCGQLQKLHGIDADYSGSPWQLGGCNYLALSQGNYLISWFEHGRGQLAIYSFTERAIKQTFTSNYSRIRHLAADRNFFYCIAEHEAQGRAVLAIERDTGHLQVLRELSIGLAAEEISRPQTLYFTSANYESVHSFFYPPCNTDYSLQHNERPPLVVFLHGGPTSACYPVFDPRIQFWTQRGFAVADLNYRGSTGFGRAYRQRLHGQWGTVEVEDICALVQHLIDTNTINPLQVCVRGGSAGGYSALLALASSSNFAAAASLYGVSDPKALRNVTHKFESDYLDWLLGSPESFISRAPLHQVSNIRTPVIFFQGGLDVVVVPEQTTVMVDSLREQGVQVDYHFYPKEGHGFRQAQHLAQVLDLELAFYQKSFLAR